MSRSALQTKAVLRLAGSTVGLQAIFSFMAVLSALNSKSFVWPSRPLVIGMLSALALAAAFILSGLVVQRALYLHVCSALMPISWAIALLAPSLEPTAFSFLHLTLVLFFAILIIRAHLISTAKMLARIKIAPMLNPANARWDLSKSFATPASKARAESLAKILLPLGPLTGTLLYQAGARASLADAFLPVLACALFFITGINLAVVNYLNHAEQQLGKAIRL